MNDNIYLDKFKFFIGKSIGSLIFYFLGYVLNLFK